MFSSPVLSEDQEKMCRIHPNYLVALIGKVLYKFQLLLITKEIDTISQRTLLTGRLPRAPRNSHIDPVIAK